MSYGNRDEAGYRVIVAVEWLDEIKKFAKKENDEDDEGFTNRYRYSASRGKVKIDVADWKESSLKKLAELLDKHVAAGDGSAKLSRGVLQQWIEIRNNPSGSTVSRFENLAESLKKYISTAERRWIFEQSSDGNMIPWFVDDVSFHPPSAYGRAHVTIGMVGVNSGHSHKRGSSENGKHVTYLPDEFNKKFTMGQFLEIKGLHLETPARVKSYEAEVEKFMGLYDEDGLQMNVTGKAYLQNGWSESGFRNVEKSGRPAKMVIDPTEEDKSESAINCPFWDKNEEKLWNLPVHPILNCFDLEEHAFYRVHVNNAETYVYNTNVGSKLVLPADMKDFIEVLIEHSKNKFVDIVGGKEGGTIILLEGPPGTGKTLTAEIYSEVMQRPLYKVQSSQLGTTPEKVEEQLKEVLQRSERWGAILLIDESDVYIYERGENIDQNAIVGVFLRVLEYYRGVLFMTTNRGVLVDDAIISRLTARFIYKNPDFHAQVRLWKVLAEQNGIKLAEADITPIVTKFDKLSGRDIKNLLKLAYVMSLKKSQPINVELIASIAKFRQTAGENV